MKKLMCCLLAAAIAFSLPVSAAAVTRAASMRETVQNMAEEITREVLSDEAEETVPADEEISETQPETAPPAPPVQTTAKPVVSVPETTVPVTEPTATDPPTTKAPTTTEAPTLPSRPNVVCFGDINRDCRVNSSDGRTVLRFCARICTLTGYECSIADVNRDNAVNSADARRILRIAAYLEDVTVYNVPSVPDRDTVYTSYDKRPVYKPYLSGFSTNIRDEKVFPKIRALEDYMAGLGNTATFYYTDVQGQYYIKYNSSRVFRTQCTIKAPYVKSLLVYMEKNNIPLSKTLTLHSSQKWATHPLSSYPSGTQFSIQTLITYALRESDNTAYQVLFDYFGPGIFNESAKAAGSSLRLGSYIFGETSSEDMAKLFLDIYRYNGKYREFLFHEMESNSSRNRIVPGVPDGIRVLNKIGTGGDATLGYHDCAIIFTRVPCVLIMFTTFNFNRSYDKFTPFRKVGSMIVDINQTVLYV